MKLACFDDYRYGVVLNGTIIPFPPSIDLGNGTPQDRLTALIHNFPTLRSTLEDISRVGVGLPLSSVRLRPPVPRPVQLLCAVKNYADDRQAVAPDFFLKSSLSIIGSEDTVRLPPDAASVFHAEPELAVVIGRDGSEIAEGVAFDHVFGYTAFLDVSARDIGTSFYQRKSFETFGPMGPVLVTKDEFGDPQDKEIKLFVNNTLRQNFSTRLMANGVGRLVALASHVSGLVTGDVIATGTYHLGLGPIQDGDRVTLEIAGVDRLSVNVVDASRRLWPVTVTAGSPGEN